LWSAGPPRQRVNTVSGSRNRAREETPCQTGLSTAAPMTMVLKQAGVMDGPLHGLARTTTAAQGGTEVSGTEAGVFVVLAGSSRRRRKHAGNRVVHASSKVRR